MNERGTSRETDEAGKLAARYERIAVQLVEHFQKYSDPVARMAAAAALLHHKMPDFFWTGFYRLIDGDLVVGPYQGPLACSVLERGVGVCWACIERDEQVIVPNVHEFPGHIPCDSRSNSEIVVPMRDSTGNLAGVLDIDSTKFNAFSGTDAAGLMTIAGLIYQK